VTDTIAPPRYRWYHARRAGSAAGRPLAPGLAGGGTDCQPPIRMSSEAPSLTPPSIAMPSLSSSRRRTSDHFIASDLESGRAFFRRPGGAGQRQAGLHAPSIAHDPRLWRRPAAARNGATWWIAPPGSGLGSSSALWWRWWTSAGPATGTYESRTLAYEIERVDLALSGAAGQYAAPWAG